MKIDLDISDVEFLPTISDENNSDSDSEIENEIDNNVSNRNVASSIESMFVSKNQMAWSATPFPQPIGSSAYNIMTTHPGVTRFAVSRCFDILSSLTLFFPTTIEKLIIENTNKYGRNKFHDKWKDIDEVTLHAFWYTGDISKKRPTFLRQLALALADEYMKRRLGTPRLQPSADLLTDIRSTSALSMASSSSILSRSNSPFTFRSNSASRSRTPAQTGRKRGHYSCCNSKTDIKCTLCDKFVCKKNRDMICLACIDRNFQPINKN